MPAISRRLGARRPITHATTATGRSCRLCSTVAVAEFVAWMAMR